MGKGATKTNNSTCCATPRKSQAAADRGASSLHVGSDSQHGLHTTITLDHETQSFGDGTPASVLFQAPQKVPRCSQG